MSEIVDSLSDWEATLYTCACGWRGNGAALGKELFAELLQADCPSCFTSLVLVRFPTEAEIKAAAAAGNRKAQGMLGAVLRRERFLERHAESLLRSPAQLPEVDETQLGFVIDLEESGPDRYYVIKLGAQDVWRELAAWEDWRRFNELKEFLRAKYGARFASLTPTRAARTYLLGDLRETISTT